MIVFFVLLEAYPHQAKFRRVTKQGRIASHKINN
jgi:hypothetical protein